MPKRARRSCVVRTNIVLASTYRTAKAGCCTLMLESSGNLKGSTISGFGEAWVSRSIPTLCAVHDRDIVTEAGSILGAPRSCLLSN